MFSPLLWNVDSWTGEFVTYDCIGLEFMFRRARILFLSPGLLIKVFLIDFFKSEGLIIKLEDRGDISQYYYTGLVSIISSFLALMLSLLTIKRCLFDSSFGVVRND